MHTYDYSFFDKSIENVRTFKGCDPWWIFNGAKETGDLAQFTRSPSIVFPSNEMGEDCIFEAASYATSPGRGLPRVQELVGHPLPEDFLAFYERYEKALVVTRTYPLHLWHEEKIIGGIYDFCAYYDRPFRLLRFGDQYDRQAAQIGLWLEEPGTMKWRVISTQVGSNYLDDATMDPGQIMGPSFYEWLKDWVDRDGLPGGLMGLGPEGGFMDPPTQEDLTRIAARQQKP